MSIELTEQTMALAEAVVINHGALTGGDAMDLAWDTVRAVLPQIEADIREEIARDIEVPMRRHDGAQIGFSAVGDAYAHAARIVRGEKP